MGGLGSGRYKRAGANRTTDDYYSIDVRRWKRDGLLPEPQSFIWQWFHRGEPAISIRVRSEPDDLVITYSDRSSGPESKEKSYTVFLDWTACHIGSERPWFLCPAPDCRRRVAILYGDGFFTCRQCHQLAYNSQRINPDHRAMCRAGRIRERLGWRPGISNGHGDKPKGMHWKTFERLNDQHDAFAHTYLGGVADRFNIPKTPQR